MIVKGTLIKSNTLSKNGEIFTEECLKNAINKYNEKNSDFVLTHSSDGDEFSVIFEKEIPMENYVQEK